MRVRMQVRTLSVEQTASQCQAGDLPWQCVCSVYWMLFYEHLSPLTQMTPVRTYIRVYECCMYV